MSETLLMSDPEKLFLLALEDSKLQPAKKHHQLKFNSAIYAEGYVIMEVSLNEIELNCLLDVSDFFKVKDILWRTDDTGYAFTEINRRKTYLHRLLFELRGYNLIGIEVDHKNGNRLDNRNNNLRLCSKTQNTWNSKKKTGTYTSQYKGLYFDNSRGSFTCRIHLNGKLLFSKRCSSEKEAALKYNELARQYYGEFAKLNIIQDE